MAEKIFGEAGINAPFRLRRKDRKATAENVGADFGVSKRRFA